MCLLLNSQCITVEIQNNYHNSWIQYHIYKLYKENVKRTHKFALVYDDHLHRKLDS